MNRIQAKLYRSDKMSDQQITEPTSEQTEEPSVEIAQEISPDDISSHLEDDDIVSTTDHDSLVEPPPETQEPKNTITSESENIKPSPFDIKSLSNINIEEYLDEVQAEYAEEEGQQEHVFSYFDILDKPRILPEPVDLTISHLKEIEHELGLIRLCWPELENVTFEGRENFPASYLNNNDKERVLLLYTENFRKQFSHKYPDRKPLFLASDNECGVQKMVCTTLVPTKVPYPELDTWEKCAKFIGEHIMFESLKEPTLLPTRLYSPNTTTLRQKGEPFEIATVLCSLLLGFGHDAYVVSGYANKDITTQNMRRVNSPFSMEEELEETQETVTTERKYKLKSSRDLRSKFLLMMEQREIDKVAEQKAKEVEEEQQRILEEEKLPFDELGNRRVHGWVLLKADESEEHEYQRVETSVFIEPSTGYIHPLNSPAYLGIESIWNNWNYWVNMQGPKDNLSELDYDFTKVDNWEHLLVGEPCIYRKHRQREGIEEDPTKDVYDEKHLDIPKSWSWRIAIPHYVLQRRFPSGSKKTFYKRCFVEEFAPYVLPDGLVSSIVRYEDFDCTQMMNIEERFENREDKLRKRCVDIKTDTVTEYFAHGRDDCIKKHILYQDEKANELRTIEFYHQVCHDGMSKIEVFREPDVMIIHYIDREDKLYYQKVLYYQKTAKQPSSISSLSGDRKPIKNVIEKYGRLDNVAPDRDIAVKEFKVEDREISLKYHYAHGKVTANTRYFIKPPIAELGEGMKFHADLTGGYESEINAKVPKASKLYLLLEEELKYEEKLLLSIRHIENFVFNFVLTRDKETSFPQLSVSLFDREHNMDHKLGMQEQDRQLKLFKEKEIEEETDYLAPYLTRLGNPEVLTHEQALQLKNTCLNDFKQLLVDRANDVLKQFEKTAELLQSRQEWYAKVHDEMLPEEEYHYFEERKELNFILNAYELRLARQRDLSPYRFDAILHYLMNHPALEILK